MKSSLRTFGFLSIAFTAFSFVAFAQPTVWTTSSLVRTGQTDAAGTTTQAAISAARGEYESFQIAVQAPAGGLTNVNVTVSDLSGSGGATIAKSNFSLFREHYVFVSKSSPDWSGPNRPQGAGWYPDALIPFNDPSTGAPITGAKIQAVPFTLTPANNQPIWVDLFVPRDAAAGQYTGTYTVTSDQGNFTGAVNLTVWNFTLPTESSLKSAFLYWTAESKASDEELMRNKISPLHTEESIQSGMMNKYGLDTVGLRYWSGADISTCSMSAPPSVAELKANAAQQQSGLKQLIYSADEIDTCPTLIPMVKQWARNMHQANINNLITMAPNPLLFDDGSGTGRSAVDIWTVLPVGYDAAVAPIATALAKGDSVWSYNALVQDAYSPKWLIDFSPVNFRIQPGFISNSLGLTGMLYWRLDRWSSDPWNNVNNVGDFSAGNYPGEGMFVYPGADVGIQGVAPSMRLKWLRDGVEDYEYLQMLKAAGQSSFAQQKSAAVGANWSSWTKDAGMLLSVREELGSQLSGPVATTSTSSVAPVTPSTPSTPAPAEPAAPVAPPATAPVAPPAAPAPSACGVSSITVTALQPAANATVQAGVDQTIRAQISDSCGLYLGGSNGSATASFSNGDSSVALQDQGTGIWTGSWKPVNGGSVTLTVSGKESGVTGNAQVSLTVAPGATATSTALIVNAASGTTAAAQVVTPGSYVTIYGTNLAGNADPAAKSTPLPTSLNGTQVFLGSQPLALIYAGPNQINGVVPHDLQPNSSYSLVVANGLEHSTAVSVSVASVQPAVFTVNASGSGQGVVAIVGDNSIATAAGNGRPANAGEYVTIYCNGLGAIAGPGGEAGPADGTATPSDRIFRTKGNVTVSFDGDDQPVQFAGLAPSMVAVYQVNVRVPAGHSGNAVPMVVKVTNPETGEVVSSNTVTVALQ